MGSEQSLKQRLDQLLVTRGEFPSRERAQRAIMAGLVRVNGDIMLKAGTLVRHDALLSVAGELHPYVSRGGLKLEKALTCFQVSPQQRLALDAGASTGGFTDVLLRGGATHVVAVDVGYGQLAWALRTDERVTVQERTNIRHLTPGVLPYLPDLIVADLSFISLSKVLPALVACLAPHGEAITLIKPQFEVGKSATDRGIVRDRGLHAQAIRQVVESAQALGWSLKNLTYSPIKGPEGNIEFLAHWCPLAMTGDSEALISDVVDDAHRCLNRCVSVCDA